MLDHAMDLLMDLKCLFYTTLYIIILCLCMSVNLGNLNSNSADWIYAWTDDRMSG